MVSIQEESKDNNLDNKSENSSFISSASSLVNSSGKVLEKAIFNYNTSELKFRSVNPAIINPGIEPEQESEIVIRKEFNKAEADTLFKEFYKKSVPDDVRLYYYTQTHLGLADKDNMKMGLFGDFAPSIIFSINKYHNLHLPYREQNLREFAHSKLCHLYCTLDKSVMYNFFNRYTAQSKVFNLNSIATIMGHPELIMDTSVLKDGMAREEVLEVMSQVKKNATKLLKDVPVYSEGKEILAEQASNFEYPKWLSEKFGHNLDSIMLYGSSAKGEGKDYDNLVVLKNLPDNLYDIIKDTFPKEHGKEVGMIFVPEYVLDKFLYINVSNTLFRDYAKVLKGKIELPIESERYKTFKEIYHSGFGSAKLVSALNLVYKDPSILFDKPGLFEYFMKLNRFTYHGLLHNNGYVMVSKDDILERLKNGFNYSIPEFKADKEHLQQAFLNANVASVEIARKMYDQRVAKHKDEVLAKINSQISRRIFASKHDGHNFYIFKGHEDISVGDVVPARIIDEKEIGYENRVSDIKYATTLPENKFFVGKRL